MDSEPDYYSVAEAAEALGTTEQNIYRAAEAGEVQLVFFPNDAADGIYRVYEVTIQDGVDGPLYSILSGHYPLFSPHAGRLMRNGSTVVNSFFDEQGIPRHFLDDQTFEPAPVKITKAFLTSEELHWLTFLLVLPESKNKQVVSKFNQLSRLRSDLDTPGKSTDETISINKEINALHQWLSKYLSRNNLDPTKEPSVISNTNKTSTQDTGRHEAAYYHFQKIKNAADKITTTDLTNFPSSKTRLGEYRKAVAALKHEIGSSLSSEQFNAGIKFGTSTGQIIIKK